MTKLYPPFDAYKSEFFPVSDLHTLYLEQSGNPDGAPVIYLNGGPGSKSKPKYRQFFNPQKYRIIMFDQRGCGKSTPMGELKENTIWDLVEDMEKIRKHLNIDKWMIFGGSWGSTLGLAYAQKHPEVITGMVLRGIFTFRKSEIDWLYAGGPKAIYPELWEELLNLLPPEEHANTVKALTDRVLSHERTTYLPAIEWSRKWEEMTGKLIPDTDEFQLTESDIASTKILFHYVKNMAFLNEGQLFNEIDNIRHIPAVIVQGRYDMVCPLITAWELHDKWPEADFHIIPDAGHNGAELGITKKLVEYTNKFAE